VTFEENDADWAPENLIEGMPKWMWENSQRKIAEAVARQAVKREAAAANAIQDNARQPN